VSLSAAAAAMGLPEALVQRSAEARAAETGVSVDEILAAWAGGETAPAGAEPVAATTEAATQVEETPTEEPAPAPEPEPVAQAPVMATAPQPAPAATAPTRAPIPDEVTLTEAAQLPEVITVPTAGIRERTNFVMPKWLTGLMVIVPLFALFALGGSSTGACGEATELATNVISGEIVNCDGSQFTGGGVGGGGVDYIGAGQDIYMGVSVAGVNCSGCHGVNGQGSATFPALTGVLTTFGSCADHIQWVTLGSAGWAATVGDTYGDTQKPVGGGGMPTFGGTLTEEQIASVATFERVRFGGEDPDQALVDCGLAEPADTSGGGAATEGGSAGSTTTTTAGG
jgi:mono/diheme cytochrome c family protein